MHDISILESLLERLERGHSIDRADIETINRITGQAFPVTETQTDAERQALLGAVHEALKRARAGRIERNEG